MQGFGSKCMLLSWTESICKTTGLKVYARLLAFGSKSMQVSLD